MNIRRTAIGTLAALLAAGAIAFRFGGVVVVFEWTVSIASLFSTVAIFCWLAFYLLDRFWYHALLRASDLPPLAIPFKSSKSGSRLIDFDG